MSSTYIPIGERPLPAWSIASRLAENIRHRCYGGDVAFHITKGYLRELARLKPEKAIAVTALLFKYLTDLSDADKLRDILQED